MKVKTSIRNPSPRGAGLLDGCTFYGGRWGEVSLETSLSVAVSVSIAFNDCQMLRVRVIFNLWLSCGNHRTGTSLVSERERETKVSCVALITLLIHWYCCLQRNSRGFYRPLFPSSFDICPLSTPTIPFAL